MYAFDKSLEGKLTWNKCEIVNALVTGGILEMVTSSIYLLKTSNLKYCFVYIYILGP